MSEAMAKTQSRQKIRALERKGAKLKLELISLCALLGAAFIRLIYNTQRELLSFHQFMCSKDTRNFAFVFMKMDNHKTEICQSSK
jgi:hypothetical protein